MWAQDYPSAKGVDPFDKTGAPGDRTEQASSHFRQATWAPNIVRWLLVAAIDGARGNPLVRLLTSPVANGTTGNRDTAR
jgi:hypothetical protein